MAVLTLEKSPLRSAARRHVRDRAAGRCGLARALVIGEEEGLVVDDRAAGRAAELVLVERRARQAGRIGEEVVGVEIVVAQKLEDRAVKLIGAALDGGVDHRAGGVAELGGEVVGLDLELLYRVDRGDYRDAVASDGAGVRDGVVVDAIERDFVGGEAPAAGDERQIRSHAEHRRGVAGEQAERKRIPAVQRHVEDLLCSRSPGRATRSRNRPAAPTPVTSTVSLAAPTSSGMRRLTV